MIEQAKITGIKVDNDGTYLKVFVPKRNLQNEILEKRIRTCEIRLDDNRRITSEQRKKAYACIRDISKYTGIPPETQKEILKYLFVEKTGGEYISLSNCSIDQAREFINLIMDVILENGIQMDESGIDRSDDTDHYLWKCLEQRVCAVCGKPFSDRHHISGSRIGMGNNRNKTSNAGRKMICLCREHHNICHKDEVGFFKRYHIYGVHFEEGD